MGAVRFDWEFDWAITYLRMVVVPRYTGTAPANKPSYTLLIRGIGGGVSGA